MAKAKTAKPLPALPSHSQDGTVVNVLLSRIKPSLTNPRQFFDEEALNELAASIKTHGVLQPLLVRPFIGETPMADCFLLVSGERRWRAAKLAGLTEVPCFVRNLDDQAALEAQIIENLQRQDVTPFEEAEGYAALMKPRVFFNEDTPGLTAQQIADRIGKSVRYVWQALGLLKLPSQAIADVHDGKLNKSVALEIATLPNDELRAKAVYELRDFHGNYPPITIVRQRIEQKFRRELKGAPFSQTDAALVPAAGSCKACPKRTGNNRELYPEGRADICTDVTCFDLKVTAHRARDLAKLEAEGRTVITGKQADKLIGWNNTVAYGARDTWVGADDACDADSKRRTWRELLKGQLETTIIENTKGERLEAYPVADASRLVTQKHKLKPEALPQTAENVVAQKALEQQQRAIRERAGQLALAAVRSELKERAPILTLRAILPDLFLELQEDEFLIEALQPNGDDEPTSADWADVTRDLTLEKIVELLTIATMLRPIENWVRWGDDFEHLRGNYDSLDWDALVKQAEAEMTTASEPELKAA